MKTDFKKVLIVSKMTEIEFDEFRYGDAVDEYYKRNKTDVPALEKKHEYHQENLEKVINCFRDNDINPGIIPRQSISKRDFNGNWDLIVAVGGDGTYMDTARYVLDDTLFLGIKSSPYSVGAHFNTSFTDAEENIKRLLKGDFGVSEKMRLKGVVESDGFTITDYALNEIAIGDTYLPGFAYLDVHMDGKVYNTGSSGIVIAPYSGRTGWHDNINLLEKDAERVERIRKAVRDVGIEDEDDLELMCKKAKFGPDEQDTARYRTMMARDMGSNFGFDYGILKPGEELKIVSKMRVDGMVFFDGSKPTKPRPRTYQLNYDGNVLVSISEKPLYTVEFG